MINLSTPSQELLDELMADYSKADYWLTKKLGGMKKQKELGDNLCLECLQKKKALAVSDYIEYISPKGNRWLMYIVTRKYEDHFYTTPMGFCYYETYGSIGAFVPTQCGEGSDTNACLIFTSHFFLRLCDRLGIKTRSRTMVKRFIEYIAGMAVSYRGEGTHAKHEVDVRLPASIGRGCMRDDSPYVVEINTFLKDSELTAKQKRETKALRECNVDLRSSEYLRLRAESGDAKGVIKHIISNLKSIGLDEERIKILANIPVISKMLCERMGLNLDIEQVKALYESSTKSGGRFFEYTSIILDKKTSDNELNTAFWEAVLFTIKEFHPSVDGDIFIKETLNLANEILNNR